jgi:hypothetical protein
MQKLVCHPNTPSKHATSIDAHVELKPGGLLWMRYHVECEQPAIILAGPEEPNRTDFLWKHTCFETFITREDQSNYIEFNFCPSSRWAAYQFTDYREGAADLPVETAPEIYLEASESHIAIEVDLLLPKAWRDGEMLMGITTIIEDKDEELSYWALKHPGEKQEFHDRSCFILPLSAAE